MLTCLLRECLAWLGLRDEAGIRILTADFKQLVFLRRNADIADIN
jgi:hypothetical protein